MIKLLGYGILIALIILIDQLVKHFIVITIALNHSTPVLSGVLSLAYIRNYGAAWSMLIGKKAFFIIISLVALALMGYFFWKKRQQILYKLGLAFMIGGTVGNFIDRVRLGYVVDMFQLDFINFPIFNVADSALTAGVIIIFGALLKDEN